MDTPHAITLRREPGPFTRSLAALILRLALGMTFLVPGLYKLEAKRRGEYPGTMFADAERAHVPGLLNVKLPLLKQYAEVLPYAEVGVGVALIAGFWTTLAGFASGLLLLSLLFGHLVQMQVHPEQEVTMVPLMLVYLAINAAVLWLSPVTSNYLSLDGLLFGWFWAPRPEGEYRRDERVEPKRR
ncbi:MAG TPA: DoxX family membrane protein [Isosphaeraceae bacterium]|jgi:uncharacterized membrane protein YphA (DoxX/SURF4 family)|nr:DoxX family membrane protein [Isosphaeraceae bacterium]